MPTPKTKKYVMTNSASEIVSCVTLCGVAASFLTIAIPLQLSGHWIAIAWAAEALLLFELGLRFNEIRLRAAGFAMLTIVQIILAFYVSATVDDPRDFRTTRFLPPGVSIADTLDPAYGVRESAATTTAREPSWADVFNGRSFSFLASAIVMAVMAWEYRRREQSLPAAGEPAVGEGLMTTGDQWDSLARIDRSLLSGWLIAGMAVTVLGVLMIETFVAGHLRNWTVFSFVSAFAVWAAVIAVAIVLFATREGPAWLCRVGLGIFAVAAVMLGINAIATVGEVLSGWGSRAAAKTAVSIYSTPLWNPRGLSFLIGAAALTVIAFEIRKMTLRSGSAWDDSSLPQSDLLKDEEERFRQLQSGGLIAGVAVTLLVAVSIETLVAGQSWNWTLTSVLSGLTFWMFLFGAGLATFSVWKGPRWLSNVGLGGFGLAAVMLTANAIGTLSGFRGWWSSLDAAEVASTIYRLPILNPRGLSFLWGIGCCLAVLVLLRRAQKQEGTVAGSAVEGSDAGTRAAQHRVLSAQAPGSVNSPIDGPLALGLLAYLSGLTMLTIEVYAHGVVRGWASGTNLAATFVWIVYAMATLAGGLVFRSSLLRQLALGLFLLTTAKVFLYDIWQLNRAIRTFSFVGLGATLLMVSFLYRRYRDRIHAWINPAMLLIAAGGMLAVASPSQIFADDAPPIWTRLSHRWPITTPENPPETDPHSLYRIPLPLTLYGIAHPDLSDIRILPREPAGKDRPEVPYVLESFPSRGPWAGSDTPGKTIPLRILKSTHDENAGRTVLLLDAELHRLPMRELRVEVEGTAKYSRPVTLRAANHLPADDTPSRRTTSVSPVVPATANWRTIHTGKLVRKVTADGESKTAPLTFMQSSARYLELTIHDGDDAPLNVTGAAVGLTEFSLLITQQSFAEAGTALAIHAGGEQLASPEYDLVRTMDRSRIATAAELSTREVEPNPLYSLPPPPPTPWTEQNAGLVWTITIAGVIILGMVTVLILRAAARSQSTQESGSEEQQ